MKCRIILLKTILIYHTPKDVKMEYEYMKKLKNLTGNDL